MTEYIESTSSSCSMIRSAEMNSSTSSKFCQVVFHDLEEVYATDCDIKARYSIMPGITAKAGDQIGLYKVGWTSANEFITFIFAPLPTKPDSRVGITIPVESFVKTEGEMYQLCYITCDGEVIGASIPFTFRVPSADELVAVLDPLDPGLVVYKSRTSQMQDELVTHRAMSENYEETIKDLQSKLSKLNLEMIGKMELLDNLTTELQDLQDIVTLKDSEISELKNDKSLLEVAIGVLKDKQQKNDSVTGEYQEILNRKEQEANVYEETIKKLRQNLQEASEASDNWREEIEVAKCEKESLEHAKENLMSKVKELSTRHNATVLETIELNNELKDLKDKLMAKERELEDSSNAGQKFKEELAELRSTFVSSMSGEEGSLQRALVKSEDEKSLYLASIFSLEEALEAGNKRSDELLAEVALLKKEKEEALIIKEKAEKQKKETEAALHDHLEHYLKLGSQENATETIASLKSRVAVLEIELANKHDKNADARLLHETEQERESLRKQVENVNKNCEHLRKMTSSQYAQIVLLTEERDALSLQLKEMLRQLSEKSKESDAGLVEGLKDCLDRTLREKHKLEATVLELRKELIGKVSVGQIPRTPPYSG